MSFYWDFCLKEKLRNILLNLVDGKTLSLEEIAKEMNIELCNKEDRLKLQKKIYGLKKNDKDIKLLMSRSKRYFIAEYINDRMDMHYKLRNISSTYQKKSEFWLVRAREGKIKDKPFEQLAMDFMKENYGVTEEKNEPVTKEKVVEEGK